MKNISKYMQLESKGTFSAQIVNFDTNGLRSGYKLPLMQKSFLSRGSNIIFLNGVCETRLFVLVLRA